MIKMHNYPPAEKTFIDNRPLGVLQRGRHNSREERLFFLRRYNKIAEVLKKARERTTPNQS